MLHGEPYLKWSESEVEAMNMIKNLQHAVVKKFSYNRPKLEELRTMIPAQSNIKGDRQKVGTSIHLDIATINKTRLSCAKVKVLVDLLSKLVEHVRMDIEDEVIGAVKTIKANIRYD
ncbi:hypothetical protein HAX54_029307 [Datura stramonium]|uniref:Uncharacterized protein n=1 Tax=Datura stramonium TaxID=4076 RepID=A0ABS8V5N4_DATST|nr:hypothetical protein [Datura stramonium]